MALENTTIFVVDDDDGIRGSVRSLLQATGYHVEAFASAEDFLRAFSPERPGCIVLDVLMSGMDGLALQEDVALAAPFFVSDAAVRQQLGEAAKRGERRPEFV